LGGLVRLRVAFDQLVPVALLFLPRRFMAKLGKAFEQIWKFGLVSGFSERLNQVVYRCLVFWIYVQRFPALLNGFTVLSRLQIEFRQQVVRYAQAGLQRDCLLC
jgi:hypothetical protein